MYLVDVYSQSNWADSGNSKTAKISSTYLNHPHPHMFKFHKTFVKAVFFHDVKGQFWPILNLEETREQHHPPEYKIGC